MTNAYRGNIKVRFADTDANGHAFFGNYFVFADEVLGEYWSELGLDVADVVNPDFLTFTVNANMDFLGESLAGDALEVEVAAERVGNSSIVIGFTMHTSEPGRWQVRVALPMSLSIRPRARAVPYRLISKPRY